MAVDEDFFNRSGASMVVVGAVENVMNNGVVMRSVGNNCCRGLNCLQRGARWFN